MASSDKHQDREHAVLSASGAERWLSCPGSIALSELAPPSVSSSYAEEGTLAHECLEFLLGNRKKLKIAVKMAKEKYPADMVDHCLTAVYYILGRIEEMPEAEVLIETKVDLTFVGPEMFGTLDVALAEDSMLTKKPRLVVIDYKHGAGIAVDPENNAQLLYYALGIAHTYDYAFDSVELVIIQPRAHHESGEFIRSWTTDIDTLKIWRFIFTDGALATKEKDAPLATGKHCRYCPAAVICPQISTEAAREAEIVFDDDYQIQGNLPEPRTVPKLAQILQAAGKLKSWISQVEDYAAAALQRGETIEGYKLVQKRASRKWADEMRAEYEAEKKFGMVAFTEPKLLSPAQLEVKLKKLFPTESQAWLKEHVTKESSGLTMVREDDPRPAVNPAEAAFPDLPELTEDGTEPLTETKKRKAKKP
jgi:hypothetical protein